MNTLSSAWFQSIRRCCNVWGRHVQRAALPRRLVVESLEERTGLSAVPMALSAAQVFERQAHEPEQDSSLPPPFTLILDSVDDGRPDEDNISPDDSGLPPNEVADANGYLPYTLGGQDERQKAVNLRNDLSQEPRLGTTVQTELTGTPQKPVLLAKSIQDSLIKALNNEVPSAATSPVTDSYFQIQRTPVSEKPLEVGYEVTAYTSSATIARRQSAVIAAGTGQIDVTGLQLSTRQRSQVEIITLTLETRQQYQIGRPAATLFVPLEARDCSEASLLRACREGQSADALNVLIEMYRQRVQQTCFNVLGNQADAEDASQMVFLMFAQQHFKLQQTVGRWLHIVARNIAISFLRARQRRRRHESQAMKAELQPISTNDELREELTMALTQLPLPLRQAVQLRYLEGWSQQEAAKLLGWPRGTLSQRAARGLRALRQLMTPAEPDLAR